MNTLTKSTKHDIKRNGKFVSRKCACCASKNTTVHVDGADKWCECADCGHSTDLSN